MTTLIKVKDISLKINSCNLLQDVSLDIKAEDFVTIVGPNGAGKTMLIKIILDIIKPTKGFIDKKKDLKIGYVPQKIIVNPNLPITVEYFLKLNQVIEDNYCNEIIEFLDIKPLLNKQFYNLSGGEMQKVLLVNAMINKPNLLILDEPAQNLDLSGQLHFYQKLNDIYKTKKISILMVSHDLHFVMSTTKNVICLYKHICCSGEPKSITKNSKFTSIFGNNMSKLLSIYSHYHDHNHE